MPPLAVVGNLSLDVIDGAPPRVGGPAFHCARALRLLGLDARIVARCAEEDREALLPPLLALGVPVVWRPAASTAAFGFSYRGDERLMTVDALGEPWTPEDVAGVGDAEWVHVGALARSDFPAQTLAALARGRRLSLDGQGLARPARTGPLVLDGEFDRETLPHVSILKLAEEEAEVVLPLDVPEILVTRGSRGVLVLAEGAVEEVAAEPVATEDPTGAGDAFAVAYLAARADGAPPADAARRAVAIVAGLLR